MDLNKKRVAVVGLGQSNRALINYLLKEGAVVTGCDVKDAGALGPVREELEAMGVSLSLGEGYLEALRGKEYVFLTPGMRKDLPEIEAARDRGAVISGEIDLFLRRCRARVIGITGTSGKTTTTTLTGLMLKEEGLPVRVGGNIGQPLIEEVEEIGPSEWVVLELSSFQLQLTGRSPHIGAILNISPNHLDVHPSMEDYIEAKKNIFRFQGEDDYAVLNRDRPESGELAADCPSRVVWFSAGSRPSFGAFFRDGRLYLAEDGREIPLLDRDEVTLPGMHNIENILAAAAMSRLAGVSPESIASVARSFRGVAHRLEIVAEGGGVLYCNDSIATTPDRTEAALRSFNRPVILIAGGYDKHIAFDGLGEAIAGRAKGLVTLGATADAIDRAVDKALGGRSLKRARASSLEEAVRLADEMAGPGDVVLLSPACASYDMFANFRERGDLFRRLAREAAERE